LKIEKKSIVSKFCRTNIFILTMFLSILPKLNHWSTHYIFIIIMVDWAEPHKCKYALKSRSYFVYHPALSQRISCPNFIF